MLLCLSLMKVMQSSSALKAHINDNAFEVKLQIEMAISRIENGDEALEHGNKWQTEQFNWRN